MARGSGLLTATWDSTRVPDGIHQVILKVGDKETSKPIVVMNAGIPPREAESGGFLALLAGKRHDYVTQPELLNGVPMLPFHETAARFGYTTAWDPGARLLSVTEGSRAVTLNVDTGAVTGLAAPLQAPVVERQHDFLVDWSFFTDLTGRGGLVDWGARILIYE